MDCGNYLGRQGEEPQQGEQSDKRQSEGNTHTPSAS